MVNCNFCCYCYYILRGDAKSVPGGRERCAPVVGQGGVVTACCHRRQGGDLVARPPKNGSRIAAGARGTLTDGRVVRIPPSADRRPDGRRRCRRRGPLSRPRTDPTRPHDEGVLNQFTTAPVEPASLEWERPISLPLARASR